MLHSRKSLVQSNIQQFSPTKLTVDLQEARRLHRSRNRSTEYIRTFNLTQSCKGSERSRFANKYKIWSPRGPSLKRKRILPWTPKDRYRNP